MGNVKSILIPIRLLEKTIEIIRTFGDEYCEGFVLWVAKEKRTEYEIKDVWIPFQENSEFSYYIPEDEVHRINVELNKKSLIPIVQIHSHPGSAFHSCIDDEYSILHLPYSYSIVIPNYGDIDLDNIFEHFAVYRLNNNKWVKKSKSQVIEVFKILK